MNRPKKILISGGAGFIGSHLVDRLMTEGHDVFVLDNFYTGRKKNIENWMEYPNFKLIKHDVSKPIDALELEVDEIYHLACPASPPHFMYDPVQTLSTCTMGTINMLNLAKRVGARILLASSSEVYGDPLVHPQPESYTGNVNIAGPRSCYVEGKRIAETLMYAYRDQHSVECRVARIFNTYGPRMHANDGRVVSNFIIQSLQNKPVTVYGTGNQTRSFQYVSDLVNGLTALMGSDCDIPVNLGNPEEYTISDFAEYVNELVGSESDIQFLEKVKDDPSQKQPVIDLAKEKLDWEPKVTVTEGLKITIDYFKYVIEGSGEITPTGPEAVQPNPT